MNADHEEAVEFAKISKRENRVYVGNLSYDVKYRDLMEFMRGGGLGVSLLHHHHPSSDFLFQSGVPFYSQSGEVR